MDQWPPRCDRLPEWSCRRRRTRRRCKRADNRLAKKSVWLRRPAICGRTNNVELRRNRTSISQKTPNHNALPVSALSRGPRVDKESPATMFDSASSNCNPTKDLVTENGGYQGYMFPWE